LDWAVNAEAEARRVAAATNFMVDFGCLTMCGMSENYVIVGNYSRATQLLTKLEVEQEDLQGHSQRSQSNFNDGNKTVSKSDRQTNSNPRNATVISNKVNHFLWVHRLHKTPSNGFYQDSPVLSQTHNLQHW
jgi:hypothetical protein